MRPERRFTRAVAGIGGSNAPIVIASALSGNEQEADYIYAGQEIKDRKEGQKYIVDYNQFMSLEDKTGVYPIFPVTAIPFIAMVKADVKFLVLQFGAPTEEYLTCLKLHPEIVVVSMSNHPNRLAEQRALVHEMWENGAYNPVVFAEMYHHSAAEKVSSSSNRRQTWAP